MRIKTTYGQLNVGDRFFFYFDSPECIYRLKTASGEITHFADGGEMSDLDRWQDDDTVWVDIEEASSFESHPVDTEEKIEQQLTELANLRACIEDARSLLIDYDGYKTYKGLKKLIDQVDTLLMTHKPLKRKKAGE